MDAYRDAGVRLYTLSYDEPDALADYVEAHGVTFTMLSDPASEVIKAFGILNTLHPPDDHPWYGIPFPGAYAIDAEGTIVAKFFEHNFAVRPGPEQMLAAALGEVFEVEPSAAPAETVSVEVALDGDRLPMGVTREIVATFCAGSPVQFLATGDGFAAAFDHGVDHAVSGAVRRGGHAIGQ